MTKPISSMKDRLRGESPQQLYNIRVKAWMFDINSEVLFHIFILCDAGHSGKNSSLLTVRICNREISAMESSSCNGFPYPRNLFPSSSVSRSTIIPHPRQEALTPPS